MLPFAFSRRAEKTLVIVNPVAGGGRALRAEPLVADYLRKHGLRADFVHSQSTDDLRRRAAEAAASGYGCVVTLGGDGAFHHGVNGALLDAPPGPVPLLGFLPAGNGNDIAVGLGIPEDPIAAARTFLTAPPRRVDVLRARFADGSTHLYVGAGGMGLDAEAARRVHGEFRRFPGVLRYVGAGLAALRSFTPIELDAEIDGKKWTGRVLFAAVANAPAYGAGVRVAPEAAMDDGWLDVVLVGEMPWTRVVDALVEVLRRDSNLRRDEITRYRARRVVLRASRPALFHGDGEILGESPVEVEVLPAALRIPAPTKEQAPSA
jgi:YegS/Rv2252/BmrU family lipid kinase